MSAVSLIKPSIHIVWNHVFNNRTHAQSTGTQFCAKSVRRLDEGVYEVVRVTLDSERNSSLISPGYLTGDLHCNHCNNKTKQKESLGLHCMCVACTYKALKLNILFNSLRHGCLVYLWWEKICLVRTIHNDSL